MNTLFRFLKNMHSDQTCLAPLVVQSQNTDLLLLLSFDFLLPADIPCGAQIRQLDEDKWSRWSEAYAVQASKSSNPSAKLLKRKTTAKAETGAFA